MGYTSYTRAKNKELCNTCQKHQSCEYWLASKPVLGCVDYTPYDGVTTCPACHKLYVVGRDIRCKYCGCLTLSPPGWRRLYVKITPEGRVIKTFKSRPMKLDEEPEEDFAKIILKDWNKLVK